jgi:phosphoadenosine phosphosulfate reductase
MVSMLKEKVDVLVIDTGYLFPEVYEFIDTITDRLGISVTKIKLSLSLIDQVSSSGKFLFSEDNGNADT